MKLTPKCLGPFKITQEISPVAYHLELPTNWRVHDVFHASLLTPYHETLAHGPNFTRPPPDLIDGEDEYEVERIVAHRQYGRSKRLQYLIKWKGYPESDNTWEPADQVHAPELIKHYQSAAHHQSATRMVHQSASFPTCIKTLQTKPQLSIECPMIYPAFLSNASQKTSLSKNSPHSNAPSTTSTPLNPACTASSASATSSTHLTYQYIAGIVNSPTAPFITITSPCWISLAMTPQNPPALPSMEDPLPLLSSIRLLKSSPRRSQGSLPHVPDNLDSLLPLPMLQYPQDPPPPLTISSPLDKCPPGQSTVPLPAMTSPQTPTAPSSMGWSSPRKPTLTTSTKIWPPKKQTTKRSWMTMKRRSNSSRPDLSGILTPSPSHPRDTPKTADSPPSLSLVAEGFQTPPSGSRSLTMVGWQGTPHKMGLTTSHTCARSMHPPSIQLTLWSLYPIGSMKPFKGRPLDTLPSLMWSRLRTIGGSKLTLCDLGPSTSGSSPTRPSSTEPMVSSKAPSLPKTNAEKGWSARDFPSRFCIWQESRRVCPLVDGSAGDGRRDEDVTSKGGCDVIDLTNEDSSSDDEEL